MLTISTKGSRMPSSPIRKLVPYAEAAVKKGLKVYYLNIGQPDIETPQVVLEGLKKLDLKVIEYSHSAGNESYRKGLADYYKTKGIDVTHQDILITTGGSEALSFAMMSCFNPGDEVIIPEPFYANYNGFARAANVEVRPVTSSIDANFSLPPVSEFEAAITPNTRGIVICNPGNPTGYVYSRTELETLAQIVKKHNLYLIADEVYREFCYDGKEPFSCMNLEGIEDHVIMVDSVSKRYSMCGARIGALVTKNKLVIETCLKFAQARLSPPTFGQIAGELALQTPQSYFDNVQAEYQKRRDLLVEELNKIPGVKCPTPGGAFYAVAHLPIDNADRFCQWILEDFEYEGATVMMAPATGFYATPGLGSTEVRIAYVLEVEALKKSMKILAEALKVYQTKM
ncbi:MAG: pyridoxal phosphate-dependent aminotransferase [Luteibaculaceae bacterium]